MQDSIATLSEPAATMVPLGQDRLKKVQTELRATFGVEFTILDLDSESLVHRAVDQPLGDELYWVELAKRVMSGGKPELIDERDSLVTLAIPIRRAATPGLVALGTFVTRKTDRERHDGCDARAVAGCNELAISQQWAARQEIWEPAVLLRVARLVVDKLESDHRCRTIGAELEQVSQNLTNTYEEICLLYAVTQNLRISASDEELARLTLDWLGECLPAEGTAIQYLPLSGGDDVTYRARTEHVWLTAGTPPVSNGQFSQLIDLLQLGPGCGPTVMNRNATCRGDWPFEGLHELIIVPLAEGPKIFGWLATFNCTNGHEFGTVEASLLNSVSAILGIHTANRELYRQQAEFLAGVVRALTSAIDAKDPYTCGHSDRVARIAVRIAREMRCSSTTLNTLYMAGLLHDIGKIGIDDNVLRKPGRLTQAEFEHIKLHPELGYKILCDLRQLSEVLPVVLHHHEQWDGKGYPMRLKADDTPLLARITAVADAFDAMTSDRPYRQGMAIEKVDGVFREGAGRQWDPEVIDAYFRCRDDIVEISRRERANLSLNVEQWRD